MKIFFTTECLSYHQPGHPESPQRIRSTFEHLRENGFSFTEPKPCSEKDILLVHTPELLKGVKNRTAFDSDTPPLPDIYKYSVLSAGSAIMASETAVKGETGFSLMRPPGHHATKNRVMGFCYFNNIAVAAAKYLDKNPDTKAAILDIDCHHGNGTEDIFSGNQSVLYASLHQSPLYPGTGLESYKNISNFPLQPGTDENDYMKTLEKACNKIAEFNPAILGISAGFDTYKMDPLTQLNLEITTYRKIGEKIYSLNLPTFIVMEGGYSGDIHKCVLEFIRGFKQ